MTAPLEHLVLRLEAVASRLEALVDNTNNCEAEKEEKGQEVVQNDALVATIECKEQGVSVTAFDGIYNDKIVAYLELSTKIGGEVDEQAGIVKKAFGSLRELLCIAETNTKPSDGINNFHNACRHFGEISPRQQPIAVCDFTGSDRASRAKILINVCIVSTPTLHQAKYEFSQVKADFPKFLKPLADNIGAVTTLRDENRKSPFFNHLSTVSEAIGALGWVSVSPTPGPFVKEMADAGQFYANRVLKEYKDKDADHVNWVRSFQGIWTELQAYIKQHHTTGLTWNAKGGAAAPPLAGGAPPPPPPVAPTGAPLSSGGDSSAGRSALLDALNKGAGVTSGLKQVTNDMKTHKNPALRAGRKVPAGPAPAKHVPSSVYVPKPFQVSRPATRPVPVAKKPPVKELQGQKKWVVENFENNRNIVIDQTTIKQTVYIYKCKESTIVIKGKVNGVTLDSCKKTAVVVDDLISALEFVNCQSVQSQIHGEVRLVSIDKTDGVQVYLSEQSKNAEIITAKSSEMNILVPKSDGEFAEYALPEQYKSVWNGKGFVTTPTEST